MYTFKPATERVMRYRNKIRDRVLVCDMDRAKIITEAYKKYGDMLPVIKKSKAQYDYCAQCDCYIGDDELIVGARGHSLFASPQYPEWGVSDWILEPIRNGQWTLDENGIWHNPPTEPCAQTISDEDAKYLESIIDFWKDKRCGIMADAWQPDCFAELKRLNVSSYVEGGIGLVSLPLGHLVAGYKKIINVGYKAIRDEAQQWLDWHYDSINGEDIRKYTFYKAVVTTCDAAMLLAHRYGDACKAKAEECTDAKRKAELEQMAENLYWLEEHPAKTFWQACQGIMLYQVFYLSETSNPSAAF
ncbi:MAG: hypothetical protein HUJ65_00585, partial [Oscillospiraceae bacterium]|nr:hypothetical protein [Oscillospiraceae bacterium]